MNVASLLEHLANFEPEDEIRLFIATPFGDAEMTIVDADQDEHDNPTLLLEQKVS